MLGLSLGHPHQNGKTYQLHIPHGLTRGNKVDGSFISYSVEFSYMKDYAGNLSHPNTLSNKLLQNLFEASGSYPLTRIGGTTQNKNIWIQNQTEALIEIFESPGDDQPTSLSVGPSWLESFQTFPNGTRYIYGLNFIEGDAGIEQDVLQASSVAESLGESLYAFEIGNEFDAFPINRSDNWSLELYVDEWMHHATAIEDNITATQDESARPLFQAGVFAADPELPMQGDTPWTAEAALQQGIAETGLVKSWSDHTYMGAICGLPGQETPTLEGTVLNRTNMLERMKTHEEQADYCAAHGVPYVIGETNSIACQGLAGASDVFGAALWAADYTLHAASTNISRLHFHMGTPYRYSAWQPVDINDTVARAKPVYYGNLFAATALAGAGKSVVELVSEEFFSAYGVFGGGDADGEAELERVVIVNLRMYNATETAERESVEVLLPSQMVGRRMGVRRLKGQGADVADGITWAGRTADPQGKLVGDEVVEEVAGGRVWVEDSEAVLIAALG
ncbi:Beta-glucuronidase [Lasiodiplodia theobromae]|uniref:Beta-glucuronidase n=1 Tax=Lasiodiplodia theobromae TaxID=45133 RepID=A0A5N5D2T4_9PEZI|nr:Beta-glucuronidase [Lasiodiplodia theobromae]